MSQSLHNSRAAVTHTGRTDASAIPSWAALGLAGAALGMVVSAARRAAYRFENKIAVITGGSRGLGLVLARELAERGASVALLARDGVELARARRTIPATTLVQLIPADVTSPPQVEQAVNAVVRRFGRVDIIINNAGQILAAPFAQTTEDDFRRLLDVHLWGTLNMTRAALPHMSRQGQGRIINICSIGGRIPVPHLSAYCASKFAQAGLSGVMAEELRSLGIRVTTVMPGLMRTGSHTHAIFKGDQRKEYSLFSLIAGLPGTSMSAERAARLILDAAARGDTEAIVPFTVRQIAKSAALLPNAALTTLAAVTGVLPEGRSKIGVEGREMELPRSVQRVTILNERAADRNNQR